MRAKVRTASRLVKRAHSPERSSRVSAQPLERAWRRRFLNSAVMEVDVNGPDPGSRGEREDDPRLSARHPRGTRQRFRWATARSRPMSIRLCSIAAIGLGLLCTRIVSGEDQKPEHVWSYSGSLGPNHWGDLKPEFAACKNGHRQSPIDIRSPQQADLPAIEFDYKPSPLHIVDNGHTIMINYAPGSFIRVGGKRYELRQFHFHRPSEEKINGHAFDMV